MCRNIKRLRRPHEEPTEQELHDAALQFVRKISGFSAPSRANEVAFNRAVRDVAAAGGRLFHSLQVRGARPALPIEGQVLRIWIDADAAPRDVKDLVFRAAKRMEIATVLVANQRLRAPVGNPHVTAVWVDGGVDVADRYISEHAEPGDLVVTQDIPLAALLVPKAVAVLDPRGEEHTAETIGERLSIRDFMDRLRNAGGVTGGPPTYDARARQAFAAALDRVLTRLRRQEDGK